MRRARRTLARALGLLLAFAVVPAALHPTAARADNPVVQHVYTADPAPLVYDGRVYLYTGHDEDGSTYFTMKDWRVWSSADMVNWTDHGSPLSLATFSWASADAWAGQAVQRGGRFYWYVPVKNRATGRMAIGVAVSDSPTGPFRDALGHPLVENGEIDPTVFIDDDGQAYLYWGNPNLSYVRLNTDMTSYSGGVNRIPLTTAGFGTRTGDPNRPTLYEEGPWVHKRNGLYYMEFAAKCCSEFIAYSTAPGPTGPWTYRGTVMPTQGSSFTNHPGVVDFKGGSYFFYHNGALPGGGGYTRSVAVERFSYNADGTLPLITMTSSGAPRSARSTRTSARRPRRWPGSPGSRPNRRAKAAGTSAGSTTATTSRSRASPSARAPPPSPRAWPRAAPAAPWNCAWAPRPGRSWAVAPCRAPAGGRAGRR